MKIIFGLLGWYLDALPYSITIMALAAAAMFGLGFDLASIALWFGLGGLCGPIVLLVALFLISEAS